MINENEWVKFIKRVNSTIVIRSINSEDKQVVDLRLKPSVWR